MIEICDIAKETIEVLKYCDSKIQSQIPQSTMNFLNKMAGESKIEINIDVNKKISEQKISEECKDMLSWIYYNYIANDIEKKETLKIWNENELNFQKDKMEFIKENSKIYSLDNNKKVLAEITFYESEQGVYTIDHTFVDESLRGQGVAGKLVEMAVKEIEKRGGKVEATCSYAKKWLEKNR